ncbi:MAG TPA: glycoside hydrolase family 48 protein [Candidatus Omnitrophota bacterium]|nr:glycoside hydrolase family 48 protein [Candidatus Omnitrophota bacterium]
MTYRSIVRNSIFIGTLLTAPASCKCTSSAQVNPVNYPSAVTSLSNPSGTTTDIFNIGAALTASSVPDADPIMPVMSMDGRRTSGRYLAPLSELANYFVNNDGNKPNASLSTVIHGTRARAAYHVYEDMATHLCNSGATTSESQALFFNFMTLYGAVTGNKQYAQEAYAYIRYFMMPHDGAESPQLPDAKLGKGPFVIHWLIDVSGEAKSNTCPDGRPGSGVFGKNIVYNMYNPTPRSAPYSSIALGPNGQVDLTLRQKGGGNHVASFSSAPDADQWLANGAYWAGKYGLGKPYEFLTNLRSGLSEGMTPDDDKDFPDTMRFAIYWGMDNPPTLAYKGTINELYAGYQDPAAWEIMGRPKWAKNVVKFLGAAQNEFSKRYGQSGPFMPLFKDGVFGWEGSDPNTYWMGFQYRTFAHLAHYYYLTGDKDAKAILDRFVSWMKKNWAVDGSSVSIPQALDNKVNLGKVVKSGYEPGSFGLAAQGLIALAAKDNDAELKKMGEVILDDLAKNRKGKNGAYFYSDPLPSNSATYGFQNAEVGIAYGLYTLLLNN